MVERSKSIPPLKYLADRISQKEADSVSEINYEYSFTKHVYYVKTLLLWIGFILIAAMLISWVLHLIFPENLKWLDKESLLQLKSIILGVILGIFSSTLSKYFLESK